MGQTKLHNIKYVISQINISGDALGKEKIFSSTCGILCYYLYMIWLFQSSIVPDYWDLDL